MQKDPLQSKIYRTTHGALRMQEQRANRKNRVADAGNRPASRRSGPSTRSSEATGDIMDLFDADALLQGYNLTKLRIGTIASHSALDLCDGANDEGFRTLAV